MNRREFIFTGGAFAAAGTVKAGAESAGEAKAAKASSRLIVSSPALQNAAETSVGVVFAVSAEACGWVEYSTDKGLAGARRVYAGERGMRRIGTDYAAVRLTQLKPATRYFYRIGADRIEYKGGYAMKNLGSEYGDSVHSFVTLGSGAAGSFCVINDTHDKKPQLDRILSVVSGIKPAAVIWNGDACDKTETLEEAMSVFIHTHKSHPCYAADTPYMFINGNHDFRGRFNRDPGGLVMYRENTERRPEFWELGRNFVQRLGDIALIGLDTGEDKLDTNPAFAGIFDMKRYRELQTEWLRDAVESDAVKSARFKVAFCHLPLFDSNPTHNPGDIAPADSAPGYTRDFAFWQRTCSRLWGPSLAKASVQLVVAAHMHRFRVDEPAPGRPWAQIVGGGLNLAGGKDFPTVIEGKVEGDALRVIVHDVSSGKAVFDRKFR